MPTGSDPLTLARRIDRYADESHERGNIKRCDELRALATALRAKHYQRLADRRLGTGPAVGAP